MRKVIVFSLLLVVGLVLSQVLPSLAGEKFGMLAHVVKLLTMAALAFIMIHVGFEFDIDKSNLRQYGWDYVVAATAAAFPWIFCAIYFVYVLAPPELLSNWELWKESLLAARFAAPTSAGVLFSMLAAAGLGATWVYRKTRILAIFDDLDTVLLMIPLTMLIIGIRWELGAVILIMLVLLVVAWFGLHAWRIPVTWPWVTAYALAITAVCEGVYFWSHTMEEVAPIHIEVLLPAFVLGCIIAWPASGDFHEILEQPGEKRASNAISAAFMVLVGLSMPPLAGLAGSPAEVAVADAVAVEAYIQEDEAEREENRQGIEKAAVASEQMGWKLIALHVLLVTIISNLGKMFPAFCYRREAHWKERLAVSVAMFPRGEVGAGVLVISLSYGIGGPMITVAMLSLALNLLLTGAFIVVVKRLISS